MTLKQVVMTPKAPIPKVPSSQAVVVGNLVFCSGQIAIDPATNELIPGDLGLQTRQALKNLERVLEAANASLQDVVKTTIYLTDLLMVDDFNAVYKGFFQEPYPPRTVIEVSRLARGACVEIEAIVVLNQPNRDVSND